MYNDAMERTTIMADEATMDRLRALARDRGVSLAQVVREALVEKAAEHRPKPRSVGIASSGPGRTSEQAATRRTPPRSWR